MDEYKISWARHDDTGNVINKDNPIGDTWDLLRIYYKYSVLTILFNEEKLCRTIPYFIYCLTNGKKFMLYPYSFAQIEITLDDIIINVSYNENEIEIKLPLSIYKSIFINEFSKFDYKIDKEYTYIMNRLYDSPSHIIFMKNKSGYPNDTGKIILDLFTEEEEIKFKKFLDNADNKLMLRNVLYAHEDNKIRQIISENCGNTINSIIGNVTTIQIALLNIYCSKCM